MVRILSLVLLPAAICGCAGANVTRTETTRLTNLGQCIKAWRPRDDLYSPPCALKEFSALIGVPRSEVIRYLGAPDGSSERTVSYALFHLPKNELGGGMIVNIDFDASAKVDHLTWVTTQ
jgi:hypothetical protein